MYIVWHRFPQTDVMFMFLWISIVIPSEDSHQSEYIAPCDARRGQESSSLLLEHFAL